MPRHPWERKPEPRTVSLKELGKGLGGAGLKGLQLSWGEAGPPQPVGPKKHAEPGSSEASRLTPGAAGEGPPAARVGSATATETGSAPPRPGLPLAPGGGPPLALGARRQNRREPGPPSPPEEIRASVRAASRGHTGRTAARPGHHGAKKRLRLWKEGEGEEASPTRPGSHTPQRNSEATRVGVLVCNLWGARLDLVGLWAPSQPGAFSDGTSPCVRVGGGFAMPVLGGLFCLVTEAGQPPPPPELSDSGPPHLPPLEGPERFVVRLLGVFPPAASHVRRSFGELCDLMRGSPHLCPPRRSGRSAAWSSWSARRSCSACWRRRTPR